MSTRKRGTLATLGATTIAAAALLAAPPAAPAKTKSACSDGCGALVTFHPNTGGKRKTESLVIRDRKSDGHSAVGSLQIFSRQFDEWVTLGNIHWESSGAGSHPKRVKYPLREGRVIRFQACEGDRSEDPNTFFQCGHWRRDRA